MDQTGEKLRVYTFIVLAILLVFSILKFFFMGGLDSFSLVLILATVVLMLLLVRISEISSFNFLSGNIKANFESRLDQTNKRVEEAKVELDETKDRVEKLFLATMSTPMYNNLKKLANPPFGNYVMQTGLKRELYHLRDIGYVLITPRCNSSISEIPQVGEDLSIYVTVTDSGKEFIKEREKILK